jgi:hypothetical protein
MMPPIRFNELLGARRGDSPLGPICVSATNFSTKNIAGVTLVFRCSGKTKAQ